MSRAGKAAPGGNAGKGASEVGKPVCPACDTAKDFRTWGGTLRMATVLGDLGPGASAREATRNVALAARLVAAELGNTPAICRASYVHPLVIARYLDAGVTIRVDGDGDRASLRRRGGAGHTPEERALLAFLDRYFPERRRRVVRRARDRRLPERRDDEPRDGALAA